MELSTMEIVSRKSQSQEEICVYDNAELESNKISKLFATTY